MKLISICRSLKIISFVFYRKIFYSEIMKFKLLGEKKDNQ